MPQVATAADNKIPNLAVILFITFIATSPTQITNFQIAGFVSTFVPTSVVDQVLAELPCATSQQQGLRANI
uniref:hypothetical protein n=1 Tax=Trichocoleus desertorum TaxID=1481672 RepID=UPI0025B3E37C|nr:hypothetical protein [Trichocoleus desertorum]